MARRFFYPRAEVLHIVDGDTIDCEVTWDIGFKIRVATSQRFRIARINTPETNRRHEKKAGDAAEAHLRTILRERQPTGQHDINGEPTHTPGSIVSLETFKGDGLSRWIVDVWNNPTSIGTDDTLNDHMVDADHAKYKTYGRTIGQPRADAPQHLDPAQVEVLHDLLGITDE